MNLDRPLSDLVDENKKKRSGGRPNGPRRAQSGRGAGAANGATGQDGQQQQPRQQTQGQKARAGNQQAAQAQAQQGGIGLGSIVGDKCIISNLPSDVNEQQIRELFTTTVGPTSHVSLAYNSKSQSTGVATVTFRKAADATKAYQSYNGRLIDGKRPMKVEIVVDPSRVPAAPLASRLGAAPKVASATVSAASGSTAPRQPRQPNSGRGGSGGRRGGGTRSAPRPKATVESLDAEMSDWQASAGAGTEGATTA